MASKWKGVNNYGRSQGFQTKVCYDFTGLKSLVTRLHKVNNTHIKVGWISRRKHKGSGFYLGQLARMQEYGVIKDGGNIPARPYFRQALPKMWRVLKSNSKSVFINALQGSSSDSEINKIGYESKLSFHNSVMKQNMKRLAEYTIDRKGHAFQWDDTGELLHNFEYKIFKSSMTKAERQKASS